VLLNNGNGTFQTAVNYGAGDGPISLYAKDLDGDIDPDLAVTNLDSNNVSILINLSDNAEPVPTLSEWGLLIMSLLLLAAGTIAVVRRREAASRTTTK
jgi:hypothetical protein